MPILSKTYERIVLQQMINFIENKILYHRYQSGYRKHHSTLMILFKLRNNIKKATEGGELAISIFGDYSKAFDTVDFIF